MVVLNVSLELVMECLKVFEMLLVDSGRVWVFSGLHRKFIANYKNLLYLLVENLTYIRYYPMRYKKVSSIKISNCRSLQF